MVKGIAFLQQQQKDVFPGHVSRTIVKSAKQWCSVFLNRIIVYGLLAGTLALVYLGVQMLLGGTQLALIAATLASAALFQPVRFRLQMSIDRCFYRQRYNATRLVEDFGAVLRDEVDVEIVSEQLLSVVQEAMQATQVSLWLFRPEKHIKSADFYQGSGSRITAKLIGEDKSLHFSNDRDHGFTAHESFTFREA